MQKKKKNFFLSFRCWNFGCIMQTDKKMLKNLILDSRCQFGMKKRGIIRCVGRHNEGPHSRFGLTGNTGHQFEGPQNSDGSQGPQVEVGAHGGEDAEERGGTHTHKKSARGSINI